MNMGGIFDERSGPTKPQCTTCNLTFNTHEQYSNHKKRFCLDIKRSNGPSILDTEKSPSAINLKTVMQRNSDATRPANNNLAPVAQTNGTIVQVTSDIERLKAENEALQAERRRIAEELRLFKEGRKLKTSLPNNGAVNNQESSGARSLPPPDSTALIEEINRVRHEYLANGGNDPQILNQMQLMEEEALMRRQPRELRVQQQPLMMMQQQSSMVPSMPAMTRPMTFNPAYGGAPFAQMDDYDTTENNVQSIEDAEIVELMAQHKKKMFIMELEKERIQKQVELEKLQKALIASSTKSNDRTSTMSRNLPMTASVGGTSSNQLVSRLVRPDNDQIGSVMDDLDALPVPPFDPSRGVVIFWDFAAGLGQECIGKNIQIAYGMYDGPQLVSEIKLMKASPCETDAATSINHCVFTLMRELKPIPLIPSLRLVFEVRLLVNNEKKAIGWTSFDFFTEDGMPDYGRYRLPLFKPPIDVTMPPKLLFGKEPISGLGIYFRVTDAALVRYHTDILFDFAARSFYRRKTYGDAQPMSNREPQLVVQQFIPSKPKTEQRMGIRTAGNITNRLYPQPNQPMLMPTTSILRKPSMRVPTGMVKMTPNAAALQQQMQLGMPPGMPPGVPPELMAGMQPGMLMMDPNMAMNGGMPSIPEEPGNPPPQRMTGSKAPIPGLSDLPDKKAPAPDGKEQQPQLIIPRAKEELNIMVGVQVDEIRNIPGSIMYPRVILQYRIAGEPPASESEPHVYLEKGPPIIIEESAEPGEKDGILGWSDGTPQHIFERLKMDPHETLHIQLMADLDNSGREQPFAWTELPLVMMSGRPVVNQGLHQLQLFEGTGINSTTPYSKADARIVVRIYDPRSPPIKKIFNPKLNIPPVPKSAWMDVTKKATYDSNNWVQPGDAFVLFIDGARFLPDNCSATKVSGMVFNMDWKPAAITEVNAVADMNSSAYSPLYNYKKLVSIEKCDPTAILLLKMYTIDRNDKSLKVVGTSAINLFIDQRTRKQPLTGHDREFFLNEGSFQLPIYTTFPDANGALSMERFAKYKRVPCASLLVRLMMRKRGTDLNAPLPSVPNYTDGVYDSQLVKVTETEKKLYPFVAAEKKHKPIRDVLLSITDLIKNPYVSDIEFQRWIATKLTKEPKDVVPSIDMDHISPYDESLGFKISLDAAQNLKFDAFPVGLISFFPPGAFHLPLARPKTTDLYVNKSLEFNSSIKSPSWKDGYYWIRRKQFASRFYAIIDLRGVNLNAKKGKSNDVVAQHGWTIVPIFTSDGYVINESYQMPLFTKEPNQKVLEQFERYNFDQALSECLKKRLISYESGCSVFIRVADARLADDLEFSREKANTKYIPSTTKEKYMKTVTTKPCNEFFPKNVNPKEFEANMLNTFAVQNNLPLLI